MHCICVVIQCKWLHVNVGVPVRYCDRNMYTHIIVSDKHVFVKSEYAIYIPRSSQNLKNGIDEWKTIPSVWLLLLF